MFARSRKLLLQEPLKIQPNLLKTFKKKIVLANFIFSENDVIPVKQFENYLVFFQVDHILPAHAEF
jgi:hypothetical protein